MRRFLCNPSDIVNGVITLRDSEVHHLRDVLRLGVGEKIQIKPRDPTSGLVYKCVIESSSRDIVTCHIIKEISTSPMELPITLIQAIPKARKMDDILRMACEIGISEFIPLLSSRVVAKPHAGTKTDRWNKIAEAAAKQSGATIPIIHEPCELEKLEPLLKAGARIALYEGETTSLKTILSDFANSASITILIGPEGGLEQGEIATLRDWGFKTASLSNTILKSETAGIVALAAIRYHFSE